MKDRQSGGRISLELNPVSICGEGMLPGPLVRLLVERVEAQEPERVKQ